MLEENIFLSFELSEINTTFGTDMLQNTKKASVASKTSSPDQNLSDSTLVNNLDPLTSTEKYTTSAIKESGSTGLFINIS